MPKRVLYNGYTITPAPYPAEFGKWSLKVFIAKEYGERGGQLEIDENVLFDTPDEAYEGCVSIGKQVVDGTHDRYSVADL